MVKLSICIPTYNRIESLKKQIKYFIPFIDHHPDDVELIISDNHSQDGTFDYLNVVMSSYKNLKVNTNEKNIGLIGNLHIVIGMATGEYVWIVGDDDNLYGGVAEKVLNIIENNKELKHIFLNYLTITGNNLNDNPVYTSKTGYFENGFDMFSAITNSSSLGANMFLTANIYCRTRLIEANNIIEEIGENDNMALPVGWSLYCSDGPGYVIDEPCLENQLEGISWSDSKVRIFYRDHIAMCNKLAKKMGIEQEVNNLLIHNMPSTYSAIKFALFNKNRGLDNYSSKWLWSYYKLRYIKDIFFFPFYSTKLMFKYLIIRKK